jgi:hypothetical protein
VHDPVNEGPIGIIDRLRDLMRCVQMIMPEQYRARIARFRSAVRFEDSSIGANSFSSFSRLRAPGRVSGPSPAGSDVFKRFANPGGCFIWGKCHRHYRAANEKTHSEIA